MDNTRKINLSLIIYQTEDGQTRLQVKMEDETVWLTQDQMAELFQTTPQNHYTFTRDLREGTKQLVRKTYEVQKELAKAGQRENSEFRIFTNLPVIYD